MAQTQTAKDDGRKVAVLSTKVSRDFKRLFRNAAIRKRIPESDLLRLLAEPIVHREAEIEAMKPPRE